MHFTALSVVSLAVSLAAAFPSGSGFNFHAKRSSCASPAKVQFHFNDTSIGTLESCSKDVTNRGGEAPPVLRRADEPCVSGPLTNYTVVSGDTLEKIAAEFNSGVCNIAEANNLANPDFILLGQALTIPTDVCEAELDNQSCRTATGSADCVAPGPDVSATYTIVSGDTFFLISSSLGITVESLAAANPGVDPGALQIDQVINIPICTA